MHMTMILCHRVSIRVHNDGHVVLDFDRNSYTIWPDQSRLVGPRFPNGIDIRAPRSGVQVTERALSTLALDNLRSH